MEKEIFKLPAKLSAYEHSQALDQRFNIDSKARELELSKVFDDYQIKSLHNSQVKEQFGGFQSWIGLDEQTLQTPYHEVYDFLCYLENKSIKKIVDFGAGYGRVAYVTNAFFYQSEFIGYELIENRCHYGNIKFKENKIPKAELICSNIMELDLEKIKADLFFVYDFSELVHLQNFLDKFKQKLYSEKFYFVARGKGICSLIQNKYPEFWALHGVIHGANWSLYSSFEDLKD